MQKIGFIGQGFIGKHMADDFAARGYEPVRYALESPYVDNKAAVSSCDIIFVAVPTPTTPDGFDDSSLRAALGIVEPGKIVVIKSTILPGRTKQLQVDFPELTILHSPEFLREKQAAYDTANPIRTIVGYPVNSPHYKDAAKQVFAVLLPTEHTLLCDSTEAELIKYGGNCFLAMKVVYMNMLYDLAESLGANYDTIASTMAKDPRIGASHMNVLDSSGHAGAAVGRGAGGHCFPKDLAALREAYAGLVKNKSGIDLFGSLETKNNELLRASSKDLDLLAGIYGRVST